MRRGDTGSPLSVITFWGGHNGFGVTASKCLFVITLTITLLLLKLGDEEVPKDTLSCPSPDPLGTLCRASEHIQGTLS